MIANDYLRGNLLPIMTYLAMIANVFYVAFIANIDWMIADIYICGNNFPIMAYLAMIANNDLPGDDCQ